MPQQLELFPREPEPVADNVIDLATGRPLMRDPEPLADAEDEFSNLEEVMQEVRFLAQKHGVQAVAGFILTNDMQVIQFTTSGVQSNVYAALGAAAGLAAHIERYIER